MVIWVAHDLAGRKINIIVTQNITSISKYILSCTRREKISKIYRKFGTYLDNMTFQSILPEVEFN